LVETILIRQSVIPSILTNTVAYSSVILGILGISVANVAEDNAIIYIKDRRTQSEIVYKWSCMFTEVRYGTFQISASNKSEHN